MRKVAIHRTGFTFVELVASLCLISMMMAAVLPVYLGARDRARQTNCRSNLQQIGQALHLYAQDYDGRFPPQDHTYWPVMSYTKNLGVFQCPGEPEESRGEFQPGVELPAAAGTEPLYSSYRYRGGLATDGAPETLIAGDWGAWHSGERNVLRLDGSVRSLPDAQVPAIGAGTRPAPPHP
jgi:prepilin-type processing-associated H-X9-DG protein